MLGGDEQRGVSRTNFIGKANDGGGSRVFQVRIVHGEIIDSHKLELEFLAISEPHERMRQLAIDGFSTIATYNCGDSKLAHLQLRCSSMIFEEWVDAVFHATVLIPLGVRISCCEQRASRPASQA